MTAAVVVKLAHSARHVDNAAGFAAPKKRYQFLREVQRTERVGFERRADSRQVDFQRAVLALGDNTGVIDQHIEVAVAVPEEVAQRGNAFAVGHVERVEFRGELFLREFLNRRCARGGLARREQHARGAGGKLPASFKTDAAIAACDGDDGAASGLHHASYPRCRSLKAWNQSFRIKPGMHHSMHSGSIARAASALPISATSQPNCSQMPRTVALALSSLPQMNMVGLPPGNCGSTIAAVPTELKALTRCAPGNALCNCSSSDWSRLVKNFNTPFCGGASAIGLVASMTGLPARLIASADFSALAAALPLTASTTTSPNFAASAKLVARTPWWLDMKSFSLPGSRVPSTT